LQHGELMPERQNFRREFEPGADRGSTRGQQGDEQGSHPAREPYQALARNRNGHNTYRIFSNDSFRHVRCGGVCRVNGSDRRMC